MAKELGVLVDIIYMDEGDRPVIRWLVELSDTDGEFLASATAESLGEAFEQAYLLVGHQ